VVDARTRRRLLRYLKEPQQYLVEPRLFRKHIFDALWFIWLFGIMELLEAFHELNVLPVWIELY